MELPGRLDADEDAFVNTMVGDAETDTLIQAIQASMDARRPRLAARLVGLLGDHVEIEPGSALDRAQRAAQLFLHDRETPEARSWSALEDAWSQVRARRMTRIKARMRRSLHGEQSGLNRLGKPRRR